MRTAPDGSAERGRVEAFERLRVDGDLEVLALVPDPQRRAEPTACADEEVRRPANASGPTSVPIGAHRGFRGRQAHGLEGERTGDRAEFGFVADVAPFFEERLPE